MENLFLLQSHHLLTYLDNPLLWVKNNFFVGNSNKSLLFVTDIFTTYALERSTIRTRSPFFYGNTRIKHG